jgi:hypothetical protein
MYQITTSGKLTAAHFKYYHRPNFLVQRKNEVAYVFITLSTCQTKGTRHSLCLSISV